MVTYAKDSLLVDVIGRDEEIFLLDVNRKLAEHSPELALYWRRASRTSLVTALSVVRNVFHCDTETDSLLLTRQERLQCQQAPHRAVHLSYLSLRDLEPLLQNFRSHSIAKKTNPGFPIVAKDLFNRVLMTSL